MTSEEEILEKLLYGTRFISGCWLQLNYAPNNTGYFYISINGERRSIHALSFKLFNGYLPELPLQIDHVCGDKRCWNPDHLEAVSARENVLRARGGMNNVCKNGHNLGLPENVYEYIYEGKIKRRCLPCKTVYGYRTYDPIQKHADYVRRRDNPK